MKKYVYEICMTENDMPLMNNEGEAIQFDNEESAESYAFLCGLNELEYTITSFKK